MHPALGMLLVGGSFAALIVGLHLLRAARAVDPELLRKLLHIGMGMVSLSLPWLFNTPWAVLVLAGAFGVGLLVGRSSACWQRVAEGIICGIKRNSVGDLCFPAAVGVVFLLSVGDTPRFTIPILTLALADAAAALVGTRHGAHRFGRPGREKSLEGSAAFFVVALLCASVPLRVWTEVGWAETLLLAFNLALVVTLVEAFSWNGLDNLTVPLAAFLVLRALRGREPWLLAACAAVAACVTLVLAFRSVPGGPVSPTAPEVIHDTL